MSDSDTPDITEATHSRDSEGQLQPIAETVAIGDTDYEIQIKPPTTGERNEWLRRLDDEGEELSDDFLEDLLDTFAGHDPADFGEDAWTGVRPAIVDAYAEAVLAKLVGAEDTDEFREALNEAVADATADDDAGN